MQVVKNDFLAGLERDGRYKLLQVHYALMLDREYTKDADPRALPQHRLLRQQRLRHPGRRRDLLRQDRRPADVHRGRVPRRAGAGAVGVRPDQRARAQPGPVHPGARPARRRRLPHRGRGGDASATDFVLPERGCDDPRAASTPARTTPRRCATTCSTGPTCSATTYEERYNTLFRGGLRIHTTFDPDLPGAGRGRPQRAARHAAGLRRRDRLARHADRGDPGDGRRARASTPGEREIEHGARARARPGRASSSSSSPPPCRPARSPSDIIDGPTPCIAAQPGRPGRSRSRSRTPRRHGRATCGTMTWASINCAYARLSQIVGLNRVVDTTYRMAQSAYLYPGQPAERAARRSSRSPASPRRQRDEPAGHGVGRPDDRQRRPPPRAVLRRVRSTPPTAGASTPTTTPARRCSTGASR